jgi:hypothetical protein
VNDPTVLQDGTIVLMNAATYRLTLISEDGTSRMVPVQHQHPAYAVDAKQWQRYIDSAAQAGAKRLRSARGSPACRRSRARR